MPDKEEDINDNVKNLYVVKKRLSDIKMNKHGYFEYYVGNIFLVKIFPVVKFPEPYKVLTLNEYLDVSVYTLSKHKDFSESVVQDHISLDRDPRFKNYKPIQYAELPWNNTGSKMPILQLCELVKYLHRLAKLSAFS